MGYDHSYDPRKWSESEMDDRFNDLYDSIMDEVKEMFYSNTNTTYFTYKTKTKFTKEKKYQITDALYSGLVGLGYIEHSRKEDWHKLFCGKDVDSNIIQFKWKGAKNLLPYLISKLAYDKHFITEVNLHKKQKLFFGVNNTSQLMNRYKDSKKGLPKEHELIDNMLSFIEW
jgi:hypothetical protein|tara:strand:- start:1653 stop:2165 length:513 start_codon:yes stop_codon:yes gene_type:complete